MTLTSKGRFISDLVLLLGVVALSFLPVVGTEQTHYDIAAGTLRIWAAVYALTVVLASKWSPRPLSSGSRLVLDVIAAGLLAVMAWAERFPAGNHITEQAIYAAIAAMVALLAILQRTMHRTAEPATA